MVVRSAQLLPGRRVVGRMGTPGQSKSAGTMGRPGRHTHRYFDTVPAAFAGRFLVLPPPCLRPFFVLRSCSGSGFIMGSSCYGGWAQQDRP